MGEVIWAPSAAHPAHSYYLERKDLEGCPVGVELAYRNETQDPRAKRKGVALAP